MSRRATRRLLSEKRTVEAMIRLYCRQQHKRSDELCAECADLLRYAHNRLQSCPLKADKPACSHCPIHCYRPEMRQKIRQVMRKTGPRMLLHRPILALQHLFDRLRSTKSRHAKP